MFIPIRTDSPLRTTPYVNYLLIALNVGMFAVQRAAFAGDAPAGWVLDPLAPRLHQFFTYAFLHGGLLHLLGNMVFLYSFGNNINDKLGHVGYLLFYLAGGGMAGLAHVLFDGAPVVGASGAVFAVTGAYLILFPRANITVLYVFFLIGVAEIPSLWFIGIYFALNVMAEFRPGLLGGNVAHLAHIGGALYGMGVCLFLLGLRLLPRDHFDVLAMLERWNRRRRYRDLVAGGYDPFNYAPKPEPLSPQTEKIQELRARIAEAIAHRNPDEAAAFYLDLNALDPAQVLSRQTQLEIANHFYAAQRYGPAAGAYELLLKHYPRHAEVEQVRLMLGLLYARYLQRPEQARAHLSIVEKSTDERQAAVARAELQRLPS